MNIQEENSAHYFRVQSEHEQTLVVNIVDDCPGGDDAVSVENGTFTWETVQDPFLKKYVHITNVFVVFSYVIFELPCVCRCVN